MIGSSHRLVLLGLLLVCATSAGAADKPEPMDKQAKHQLFEKVFGEAVRLDPAMRSKVLAGKPGERHYVDKDGDGQPEEVWFIDTALRHPEKCRPLLVKAIDRNGNVKMGHEPDFYADICVADWNADGFVDSVIEYNDLDDDGNVDEMVMYYEAPYPSQTLIAMWSRDIGRDNLLWYDVGYVYDQALTQYRTHFGGNEELVILHLDKEAWQWVPYFENPFAFYDHDRDGVTERVIRINDRGGVVRTVRDSMDAKNAATLDDPRRFNVSVTSFGGLHYPASYTESLTLAGIPSRAFLKYDLIPELLAPAVWDRMMLTWSENDHNVNAQFNYLDDRQERWEGVINHAFDGFPMMGSPSSGPFNKRFEVVHKAKEPIKLYYHPADHRLHLYHADRAAVDIDADMDYKSEMHWEMLDTDGDGIIDTWRIDCGADGTDEWKSANSDVTDVRWNWFEVNAAFAPVMRDVPGQLLALDQRLEQAVRSLDANAPEDPVFKLVRSNFASPNIPSDVAKKLMNSDESLRFYLDIVKDRLIIALKEFHSRPDFWQAFGEARSRGDYDSMRTHIEQEFKLTDTLQDYAAWVAEHRASFEGPKVAWAQDWVPPNIGWESEKVAYRVYWGQFDFFGKKLPKLIYKDIANEPYHGETEWGMDALQVGKSGGCGGVTLYVNGEAYPVRNPAGKGDLVFEKRLVSEDDNKVTVELLAKGVGPTDSPYTVRFHCSALPGRSDSPVEILVDGGKPDDKIELGIGLVKLPQESLLIDTQAGVMGSWGVQNPNIGWIGMGIIFPSTRFVRLVDLPDEHQVVVEIERGAALTYHIQCDWLKGRRFPRCPGASDWLDELRKTAAMVRRGPGEVF